MAVVHRASKQARSKAVLRDLGTALQYNPRSVAAYYNRAKVHHQMDLDELAKRDMVMHQRLKDGTAKSSRAGAAQPAPETEGV